jgi:hypothetical protein
MSDSLGAFLWGVLATCAFFIYLWLASLIGAWLGHSRRWHERNVWR